MEARIGQPVRAGEPLARLYLRRPDDGLAGRAGECFEIGEAAEEPPLVYERIG